MDDVQDELSRLRTLRAAGRDEEYLSGVLQLARQAPAAVWVRIEAAYACDRAGDERAAIGHYEAAWRLGVPAPEQRRFLVGFGSTLRNVGRADDAVAVLAEAVASHPDYPPLQAFLAMALHASGHHRAALAAMLGLVLDLAGDVALDGYQRALAEYHRELLEAEVAR